MIVVRTNLYTERAEHIRRNRPMLIAAFAIGLVACACLLSDYGEKNQNDALRRQLDAARQLHAAVTVDLQKAQIADQELARATFRRDAVLAIAAQRRNWAPILGRAFAAAPRSIEYITLLIEAGRPEAPIFKIAGRCASAEPRIDADKCMLQIKHAFASAGLLLSGRILSLEDVPSALIGDTPNHKVAEFILQFAADPAHAN